MKAKDFNTVFPLPYPDDPEREKCPGCDKPRIIKIEYAVKSLSDVVNGIKHPPIGWRYKGYGYFCTRKCATIWANAYLDAEKK